MWQEWLLAIIAIWFIISPWVYNFSSNTGALWNSIVFGVISLVLAVWAGVAKKNNS